MHVSLPGSWITAAIEAQWGQSCSVWLGLLHRQEACEQSKAFALFQSESATQTAPNQLTFSWSLHKTPNPIMTCADKKETAKYSWQMLIRMRYWNNCCLSKSQIRITTRPHQLTLQVQTSTQGCEIVLLKEKDLLGNKSFEWACTAEPSARPWCFKASVAITTQEAHTSYPSQEGEGRVQTSGRSCLSPLRLLNDLQ